MSEGLAALHFLRPWWLLAIVPVVVLAVLWARRRAGGSHWEASIAPELLDVLLEPQGGTGARRLPWIATLALAAAAIGLAGPSWERLPQPVEQNSDSLVILFDLSLSMFAEDIAPSRLVRARQKIADVLRRRREGFTALVVYAGDAHAVVPLTDDIRTIENLLTSLSPDMMPVLGSNLGAAIDVAETLLDNAGVRQARILVVADGVEQMSDATERMNPSFPISILGVGTPEGGPIPLDFVNQAGQVLRSQQGNAIIARLDEQRLASIADVTHGRYRTLTLGDHDIDYLLSTPLPGEDETTEVERQFDTWADRGFWVCVLLIPLILSGFRRGVLVLVPMLLLPVPADAGMWDDLWQRRDQQAFAALEQGKPEVAAALFKDSSWRAAALYRSGDFPAAAERYGREESPTGLYNLGNALARQGEYQRAIAAYTETLASQPDHDDARFNKALVEKLLEEQQSAQQRDDDSPQQGGDQPQDSTRPEGDSDAQPGDDGQEGQPPDSAEAEDPDGESSQPKQNSDGEQRQESPGSRDEKQEALEQWLRRVPDDPGGLLRRKFQYETNQRLRRGEYRSQETEKIW